MDTLNILESTPSNFLIADNSRSVEDLSQYLQSEYDINTEQVAIVTNELNANFMPYFKQKWKSSL